MRSSGKLQSVVCLLLLASAPACTHEPGGGGVDDPFGAETGTTAASASGTTDSASDSGADTQHDSSDTAGDDAWGPKLDVAADTEGACAEAGCDDTACSAVDLLFVIDNSTSMIPHQEALGEAFPAFVEAMITELPASTDLHVGVTGTEMGISQLGVTKDCVATGDDGVPAAEYYLTPDEMITDSPSAQGRLHVVDGVPFYAIDTSADPSEVSALSDWFSRAALLGGYGSPIEMSTAAAGWAVDPINLQFNGEFIRDEGAVLVIFFIQDEPDQTPLEAAPDLIAKIAAAKSGCGGLDCVVAGGLVDEGCLPQVALGELFDALPNEPTVAQLPIAQTIDAATFEAVLADTLVAAVAQTCDEIGPAG